MIYRELNLKGIAFEAGDICKECVLTDCTNLELIHLENCTVIQSEEVVKEACEPCKKKKKVDSEDGE